MNDFVLCHATHGVWFGVFSHFDAVGIRHGFSTRFGGVSEPPFNSLNLGVKTADQKERVVANRKRFCDAVGVAFAHVVTAQQVHGDRIAIVAAADRGRGHADYTAAIAGTDALITNVPGVPLMLFFADCVPVLIADPIQKAIGVSHAGWKGTVAKIAQKTVLAMQAHFGTRPGDCLVGIGPSIGPCCYEVDRTVIDPLSQNFSEWQKLVSPRSADHWQLNLWEANRVQLLEIGVLPENIVISGICTACNTALFYSHRAEKGQTGRMGALITL